MKDTARILLFLDCNLNCSYCCNKQEQFSSQFIHKKFTEIDFSLYKNVCITGGEPFLKKDILYGVLENIPEDKNVFIYTNGLLINTYDILTLQIFYNVKCLNVGLHYSHQLEQILPKLEGLLPTRYCVNEAYYKLFLKWYPDRLNIANLKPWKTNDCNMPNEDWILLEG